MFREELPRVFELRDLLPQELPANAFFQRFEESLEEFPPKKKVFRHLEAKLQQLDPVAWAFLKAKLAPLLTYTHPTRGWQSLFDTISEAKGYAYLCDIGCANIRFIPQSSTNGQKTPDLEASLGDLKVLCEVKTINISEKEAQRRKDGAVGEIHVSLAMEFFDKLRSDLHRAKEQMDALGAVGNTKKIAYVVINFDDSLHEYADSYKQQIEAHILDDFGATLSVFFDIAPPFYFATVE